jgi:hypothetical protein
VARIDDLNDMRELLWESVKQADPEKRAPLFARLESVVAQIESLSASTEKKAGDPVDEIAKRRAARGAGTAASKRQAAAD